MKKVKPKFQTKTGDVYYLVGRLQQTMSFNSPIMGDFDLDLTDERVVGYMPIVATREMADEWGENGKFHVLPITIPEQPKDGKK